MAEIINLAMKGEKMDYIKKMFDKLCKSKKNPVTIKAKEKNTANANTFKGIVGGTAIAVAVCGIITATAGSVDSTPQCAAGTTEEISSDDGSAPGQYLTVSDLNVGLAQSVTISLEDINETKSNSIQAKAAQEETTSHTEEGEEVTTRVATAKAKTASTVAEKQTETQTAAEAEYIIDFTAEDYKVLCTIVEAEAGDQDAKGRILVANVILNRVSSSSFADNITDVVFQKNGNTYQFSPTIPGGRYYNVTASELTIECVERALKGEDYSMGALYFAMQTPENSWFNRALTFLFVHGDHYFYK